MRGLVTNFKIELDLLNASQTSVHDWDNFDKTCAA